MDIIPSIRVDKSQICFPVRANLANSLVPGAHDDNVNSRYHGEDCREDGLYDVLTTHREAGSHRIVSFARGGVFDEQYPGTVFELTENQTAFQVAEIPIDPYILKTARRVSFQAFGKTIGNQSEATTINFFTRLDLSSHGLIGIASCTANTIASNKMGWVLEVDIHKPEDLLLMTAGKNYTQTGVTNIISEDVAHETRDQLRLKILATVDLAGTTGFQYIYRGYTLRYW